MKKRNMFYGFVTFGLIMIAMGVSDALRGVFIPVFAARYHLSGIAQSGIVGVSYLGSLFFLLLGGRLTDRYSKKKVAIALLGIWMASLVLYELTDSYAAIVFGMFFSMGTSTMLCTLVNLLTPLQFGSAPGMVINLLFFVQGIGTTFTQKVIGGMATDISVWKTAILVLLVVGLGMQALLIGYKLPEGAAPVPVEKKQSVSLCQIFGVREFWFLLLAVGMYMIAEHGLMNWLITYCISGLGFSAADGGTCLALFFGTITVGRLVFSPLIQKMGLLRGLLLFAAGAALFYVISFLHPSKTIWLLTAAGVFTSVMYPTVTMLVQNYYAPDIRATASGAIIGVATVLDIIFNFSFGSIVDTVGYDTAMWILPVAMVFCFTGVLLLRLLGTERYKVA